MTSQKSFFNFKLFKESLKQQKYLMILHSILLFMISTLPAIIVYSNSIENKISNEVYVKSELFELLSCYNPFVMMLLTVAAVVTAIFSYNYLYNHRSVQFYHSMPHTRECIYISKFLANITALALPVFLYFAINSIMFFSYEVQTFVAYSEMIFKYLTVILMYVSVLAVASFAASLSGNFFAQLIITAFVYLVYAVSTLVITVSFQTWFNVLNISFNYNPAYIFAPLVLTTNEFPALFEYLFIGFYTIAFFVAGLLLFKFRKSESTGKFYAYNVVTVFLKYYVAFFASLLFGAVFVEVGNGNIIISYLGYVLAAFVVFIALQGIFGKSFKGMFANMKSFIVFAVIICAVVSVPLANPEIFDNHLPDVSKVDSVDVRMHTDGYVNTFHFEDYNNISNSLKLFSYNDNENDGLYRYDYTNYEYSGRIDINPDAKLFTVSYNRNYISDTHYEEWFEEVYDSDEYRAYITDKLSPRDWEDNIIKTPHIEMFKHRDYYIDSNDSISQEHYRKIKDAFETDFNSCSYDDIKDSYVYAILYIHDTQLKVYSCYENTIKAFKETAVNEVIEIPGADITRVSFIVYSYDKNEDIVVFETMEPSVISEILERSVTFGSSVNLQVDYADGRAYEMRVNIDNLPEFVKNAIENIE